MKQDWSFYVQFIILVFLITLLFFTDKSNIMLCIIAGIISMSTNLFCKNKYIKIVGSFICATIFIYVCIY